MPWLRKAGSEVDVQVRGEALREVGEVGAEVADVGEAGLLAPDLPARRRDSRPPCRRRRARAAPRRCRPAGSGRASARGRRRARGPAGRCARSSARRSPRPGPAAPGAARARRAGSLCTQEPASMRRAGVTLVGVRGAGCTLAVAALVAVLALARVGDGVGPAEPAGEVHVGAAARAERPILGIGGAAADRAFAARRRGLASWGVFYTARRLGRASAMTQHKSRFPAVGSALRSIQPRRAMPDGV